MPRVTHIFTEVADLEKVSSRPTMTILLNVRHRNIIQPLLFNPFIQLLYSTPIFQPQLTQRDEGL
jgi:hypothetical protein